jgi:hypothetical protein
VLCQSWEGAGQAGNEQDDEHGSHLERRVVLILTRIGAGACRGSCDACADWNRRRSA